MMRANLLAVAAVLVLSGCSESPVYPAAAINPLTPAPEQQRMSGIVVADGSGQLVHLRDPYGDLILLFGAEAGRLTSVNGAEVILVGDWVSYGGPSDDLEAGEPLFGFSVTEFTVIAVDGRPALDGVLVTVEGGYALHLADGQRHFFEDLPAELATHVGARIWVTGSPSEPPIAFGLIR